ncbi:MAG: ATP-binding protein [Acidobacteriota bacterium]
MTEEATASAVCPICEGRGWIVEPDGKAGTARPCECQKRGAGELRLTAAGIPPRYQACRFTNFRTSMGGGRASLLEALSGSQRYVDEFLRPDGRFCETGLLYIGPPGVGKTHLAAAVLAEVIQRYGVRGRFVDFTSLIFQIQSTFDPGSPESKHDVLDPVVGAELLVLDELGAQKPTAWVTDTLYYILNARYTRRLPTLFTTNYRLEGAPQAVSLDRGADSTSAPEMLSARIPAMLISRLYEMARPLRIDSSDYRKMIAGQQLR